jgi:nitrate reductase NapE component
MTIMIIERLTRFLNKLFILSERMRKDKERMRKIKSQEQIDSERARNIKFMSIFMLVVLLLGTVGYAFSGAFGFDGSGSSDSNDLNSGNSEGFTQPSIIYGNTEIPVTLKKEEVLGVSVEFEKSLSDLTNGKIYIDFGNEGYLVSEIQRSVGLFNSDIRRACYGPCEEDLPERTCKDEGTFIVYRESEQDSVKEEGSCIFIDGDLKAVDAFIYKIFGQ